MPRPELQAKADEKFNCVQLLIRNIEHALKENEPQDREWLRKLMDPGDQCFRTLLRLVVEPKYACFVRLRCVALRAIQMMLRIAVTMVPLPPEARGVSPDLGMRCLAELAGPPLAEEVFPQIAVMAANKEEPMLALDAMLVLAELGPKGLSEGTVPQLLDLLVVYPDRAAELAEVALRVHAYNGAPRKALLTGAVQHEGGRLLGEVLLQVINRSDNQRRLRAVKVLTGCLSTPCGGNFLFTNDALVLVEILMRELPIHAGDPAFFVPHADCFKVLTQRSEPARLHRRDEVRQMLEDLRDHELNPAEVRAKCAEVLRSVSAGS